MPTLLPTLDPAGLPMAEQIAAFYAHAIEGGRLGLGERLPPIREVAKACDVRRATVQEGYRRLAVQGLVAGEVGRGTVVIATATNGEPAPQRRLLSAYAEAAVRRSQEMTRAPALADGTAPVANFAELSPDDAQFPVDEWREAMDAVLQQRGGELLGYGHHTGGLLELRQLLAERMHDIDPGLGAEQLLVTAGAQQALDLVLRTLCGPGDTVVVTSPSYHNMHGLLRAHGVNVVSVAFGPDGLDLAHLQRVLARPSVKLCYLMPTFHNPTGRTLDLEQRHQLAAIVQQSSVVVLEDEYQYSLRCRGEALPSLRSLDARGLTVTVATVSKELFPALRIGWVAGSPELLQPMAAVKGFMDLESSPLLQAALVEFVRRGHFDRHLDGLRAELRRRHDALQRAAAKHLPDGCRVTDPDGGFVAWLELPLPGHGERLAEACAKRGVRVVPGRAFDLDGAASRGVRLSLTRADVDAIERGVRVLGECARELLRHDAVAQPFL
ncbi:MAG: PLP-dependent aminotransferase family protein [Planctomycetes bacterium]|nr:PLP-dependent aminotransferase family protein [Planctomycetota bacterium]